LLKAKVLTAGEQGFEIGVSCLAVGGLSQSSKAREAVQLAFVAAIQLLPARQRGAIQLHESLTLGPSVVGYFEAFRQRMKIAR
jgi:hypothetical protein